MKNTIAALLYVLILCCCCTSEIEGTPDALADVSSTESARQDIIPNTKVVKFSAEDAESIIETPTLRRMFPEAGEYEARHRQFGLDRWYIVTYEPGTKASDALSKLPETELVEDLRNVEFCSSPIPFNDPGAYKQWHLYNDGSLHSGFRKGADINVAKVWNNYTGGSRDVIVAVIDTGVDATHPDLTAVTVPDGENGSRNFIYDYSSTPYKTYAERHGTHVGGIIGAINNNGYGCCGVAGGTDGSGGVRILSCQALSDKHSGSVSEALVWAADHGAVIANNSWNFSYDSESKVPDRTPSYIADAIDYFVSCAGFDSSGKQTGPMAGGLALFSAGNKGWAKMQPSMYDNVLAVGACGPAYESSSYTNYGDWVDICAPGGDYSLCSSYDATIYSTVPGPGYAQMQGTSQACPVVSGVAALIVSHFGGQGFTPAKLKEILLGGADYTVEKYHTRRIGPMVDAYGSFLYMSGATPDVTDFTVDGSGTTLIFKWKVQDYGGDPVYAYTCYASASREEIENLDPDNVPQTVFSVTTNTSGKTVGSIATRPIYHVPERYRYYCTILSSNKTGDHSEVKEIKEFQLGTNHPPQLTVLQEGPFTVRHNSSLTVGVLATDPDGDEMSFSTSPGGPAGTWTVTGANMLELNITGDKAPAGGYIAGAVADDPYGGADSVSISYTILPNRTPELIKEIEDVAIRPDSEGTVIALDRYFHDEDGDALTFGAGASNETVAASVSGSNLTLKGTRNGESIVTVTAADAYGLNVQTRFKVLSQKEDLAVYPIPAHDVLHVRPFAAQDIVLRLFSAYGGEVLESSASSGPFSPAVLDISDMAPGVYTLKAGEGDSVLSFTVVKI